MPRFRSPGLTCAVQVCMIYTGNSYRFRSRCIPLYSPEQPGAHLRSQVQFPIFLRMPKLMPFLPHRVSCEYFIRQWPGDAVSQLRRNARYRPAALWEIEREVTSDHPHSDSGRNYVR